MRVNISSLSRQAYFAFIIKHNAQLVHARDGASDLAFEQVGDFFVENLRCQRIAHVVIFDVVLRRVDVHRGKLVLLNPEPINVVLKSEPGGKKRGETVGVVVAGNAAVHAPILVGNDGTEVNEHVQFVQIIETDIGFVFKKISTKSSTSMSLVPERKVWAILMLAVSATDPWRSNQDLSRTVRVGVGFQIHRRIDDQFASIIVVRHFADRFAQNVEKCSQISNDLRVYPLAAAFKSFPRLISSCPSDSGLSSTRA